jgi:hypothetical protein
MPLATIFFSFGIICLLCIRVEYQMPNLHWELPTYHLFPPNVTQCIPTLFSLLRWFQLTYTPTKPHVN